MIITDAAVEVKLSDSKNKVLARDGFDEKIVCFQTIAKYDYPDVSDCSCSQKARTCFGLIARKLCVDAFTWFKIDLMRNY